MLDSALQYLRVWDAPLPHTPLCARLHHKAASMARAAPHTPLRTRLHHNANPPHTCSPASTHTGRFRRTRLVRHTARDAHVSHAVQIPDILSETKKKKSIQQFLDTFKTCKDEALQERFLNTMVEFLAEVGPRTLWASAYLRLGDLYFRREQLNKANVVRDRPAAACHGGGGQGKRLRSQNERGAMAGTR